MLIEHMEITVPHSSGLHSDTSLGNSDIDIHSAEGVWFKITQIA